MKLNDRCTRAVLEAIEETSTYYDSFCYTPDGAIPKSLQKYSHDQIIYHIHHCDQNGYLEGCSILGDGGMIRVDDLSKAGHEYLKAARNKGIVSTIRSTWEEKKADGIWALLCAIWKAISTAIKMHFTF